MRKYESVARIRINIGTMVLVMSIFLIGIEMGKTHRDMKEEEAKIKLAQEYHSKYVKGDKD